jgi:hypothetical protein
MILAQGWFNNKVRLLVLSRCHNGMDGWQVYRGEYDPKAGGTYETAVWECLGSSHNLVELLYYPGFSEMAQWVDGGKSVKNLQDVMLEIHGMMKQVAAHVQQLATQPPAATIPAR